MFIGSYVVEIGRLKVEAVWKILFLKEVSERYQTEQLFGTGSENIKNKTKRSYFLFKENAMKF